MKALSTSLDRDLGEWPNRIRLGEENCADSSSGVELNLVMLSNEDGREIPHRLMRSVNYALHCTSPRTKIFAVIAQCSQQVRRAKDKQQHRVWPQSSRKCKWRLTENCHRFGDFSHSSAVVVAGVNFQPVWLQLSHPAIGVVLRNCA